MLFTPDIRCTLPLPGAPESAALGLARDCGFTAAAPQLFTEADFPAHRALTQEERERRQKKAEERRKQLEDERRPIIEEEQRKLDARRKQLEVERRQRKEELRRQEEEMILEWEEYEQDAAAFESAAAGPPRIRNPPDLDPDPGADNDFDFSGPGRPFRRARGKASRVRGGREAVQHAKAQLRGEEPMQLVDAGGVVRHGGPLSPFSGMGATVPTEVRARFIDFVVARVREAMRSKACWWTGKGLKYASLDSGELLFDLELIERLRAVGVRVVQICLIDQDYLQPRAGVKQALREFADWQRAVSQTCCQAPPEILAFSTLADYHQSLGSDGAAAGCHLFVQSDPVKWDGGYADHERLVGLALVAGGFYARLGSSGAAQEDEREQFRADAWTRSAGGGPSLRPYTETLIASCNAAIVAAQAAVPTTILTRERAKARAKAAEARALREAKEKEAAKAQAESWANAQEEREKTRIEREYKEKWGDDKTAQAQARARLERARQRRQENGGQLPPTVSPENYDWFPPTPQDTSQQEWAQAVPSRSALPPRTPQRPARVVIDYPVASPVAAKPTRPRLTREQALRQGLSIWRVVSKTQVPMREKPRVTGKIVGALSEGGEVFVDGKLQEGWLRVVQGPSPGLPPEEAWVFSDASHVGAGKLLEKIDG